MPMSGATKAKMRAVAERLVGDSRKFVAQQREIVNNLKAYGADATAQERALEQSELTLKTYKQDLKNLSVNDFPS